MLQNIRYLPMEQSFLSNEIDTLEFPSRDSVQYGRRYQQKLLAFFLAFCFWRNHKGSDPSTHVMTKSMICFFICNDPFVYCTKKKQYTFDNETVQKISLHCQSCSIFFVEVDIFFSLL